ncbi:hypothetical protein [Spirosoma oryzae]|uniref:hypothetical protein n=1 Tax=Spirosoma oryzae TaxID=1469603 RepID=UPI0011B291E0|nr:hypothetical protein [Spirosoma oryzae]
MQSNEEALVQTLNPYFSADKRRIKFLAMLIVALLKLTDSSLAQWALAINQPTQRGARFRRAQRFLMQCRLAALWTSQRSGAHPGSDSVSTGQPLGAISGVGHCPSADEHSATVATLRRPGRPTGKETARPSPARPSFGA